MEGLFVLCSQCNTLHYVKLQQTAHLHFLLYTLPVQGSKLGQQREQGRTEGLERVLLPFVYLTLLRFENIFSI